MFDFVHDEKSFLEICSQHRLKWFPIPKPLLNSEIRVGWYQGKRQYVRKKILMANIDFEQLEQNALSDCIYSKEFTVLKEIYINKLIQRCVESHNFNSLPILTSFVSVERNRPIMNLILPYVRRTLLEYQDEKANRFAKNALTIGKAIIVQMYMMDTLHIHHGDLHEENIMLEKCTGPRRFQISVDGKEYFYMSNICVYIIDFGLSHVDSKLSNMSELKRFFSNATGFQTISNQIANCQNYNDLFEKIFL